MNVERHCPLQIEIGDGQKITRNPFPDNPEHLRRQPPPFLPPSSPPPSSPSRLMLLYLQPSPRIRGVETTSRHFVCADRQKQEEITEEKERLRRPTAAAPRNRRGKERVAKSRRCYQERRARKHRQKKKNKTDKTSVEGKPSRR